MTSLYEYEGEYTGDYELQYDDVVANDELHELFLDAASTVLEQSLPFEVCRNLEFSVDMGDFSWDFMWLEEDELYALGLDSFKVEELEGNDIRIVGSEHTYNSWTVSMHGEGVSIDWGTGEPVRFSGDPAGFVEHYRELMAEGASI